MSDNLYASVAEFKDRMSITDSERDFAIDRILQSASRWIDKVTGRRFYTNTTPEIRYYTACDPYWRGSWYGGSENWWELEIDDTQSLTELATDNNGDGVYETVWTLNTDYHLYPPNATVNSEPYTRIARNSYSGRYSLPANRYGIRLTGTFGYCTLANVPANIREATLLVAEPNARPIMDLAVAGVQSYKIGTELTVLSMEARAHSQLLGPLLDPFKKMLYVS